MQAEIIQQLKAKSEAHNSSQRDTTWSAVEHKKLIKQSQHKPLCLSASFFINNGEPLYMNFHDAASNKTRHFHDFFEINYVISGTPIGVINDVPLELQAGNLYIMNPNAVHAFDAYVDNQDLILNIVIPKETFQKVFFSPLMSDPVLNAFFMRYRLENQNQDSFLFVESIGDEAAYLIDILVKEYLNKDTYSLMMIESLLSLLFAYILRHYRHQPTKKESPMSPLLDYLYQHYATCTLGELAQRFGYHPKYLSSLIRQFTGLCFRDLMTQIRLKNSEHFLLYTDDTIEHIVTAIGYRDKSSFYNSFKKHYHQSPSEFRQGHAYNNASK